LAARYRRGDLFATRVVLMEEWATCLPDPAAEVVRLIA
jgi:hypothetical protein